MMYRPRLLSLGRFTSAGRCRPSALLPLLPSLLRAQYATTELGAPQVDKVPLRKIEYQKKSSRRAYPKDKDSQLKTRRETVETGIGLLTGVNLDKDSIVLTSEDFDIPIPLDKAWLRDSCQCHHCVDPDSGQKHFASTDIPDSPEIKSAAIGEDLSLRVEWANDFLSGGPHSSTFTKKMLDNFYLLNFIVDGGRLRNFDDLYVPRQLWNRQIFEEDFKTVSYSDWVEGGERFWEAFIEFGAKGLIMLDGVPHSETAVVDIASQMGHLQNTFYGLTWDVVSKPNAENIAYTNEFLPLHQDLLYYQHPPAVQFLHCLHNDCGGGESLFSDGVRAAYMMESTHPSEYHILGRRDVFYKYDRGGHLYRAHHPVFENQGGGQTVPRCYWSPQFQDILSCAPRRASHDIDKRKMGTARFQEWKKAAKIFSDAISAPENVVEFKLKPGQCVVFQNDRILHGRRQFDAASGQRWLKGAYVERKTLVSKLRQVPPDLQQSLEPLHQRYWTESRQISDHLASLAS